MYGSFRSTNQIAVFFTVLDVTYGIPLQNLMYVVMVVVDSSFKTEKNINLTLFWDIHMPITVSINY